MPRCEANYLYSRSLIFQSGIFGLAFSGPAFSAPPDNCILFLHFFYAHLETKTTLCLVGTSAASDVNELWSFDDSGDGTRQSASESDGLRSLHNRTVFGTEFRVPGRGDGARCDVTTTCTAVVDQYFEKTRRQGVATLPNCCR